MLKTIAAGLVSAPLVLNSPGGHQILHEIGLRVTFADAVVFAGGVEGHEISFNAFKTFAPFYLQQYYGEDQESWEKAIDLLALSFCLPRDEEGDQRESPDTDYAEACHAATRKEEDAEDKTGLDPHACCG